MVTQKHCDILCYLQVNFVVLDSNELSYCNCVHNCSYTDWVWYSCYDC